MTEINDSNDLIGYLENYDILFRMNKQEADIITHYLLMQGYGLGYDDNGQLYQVDMQTKELSKTDIDSTIDFACEINYEMVAQGRNIVKRPGEVPKQNILTFGALICDQKMLDNMFLKTYYQKNIMGKLKRTDYYLNMQKSMIENMKPVVLTFVKGEGKGRR